MAGDYNGAHNYPLDPLKYFWAHLTPLRGPLYSPDLQYVSLLPSMIPFWQPWDQRSTYIGTHKSYIVLSYLLPGPLITFDHL